MAVFACEDVDASVWATFVACWRSRLRIGFRVLVLSLDFEGIQKMEAGQTQWEERQTTVRTSEPDGPVVTRIFPNFH